MLARNHIYQVHVLDGLHKLADESIDMVITSPPYWGLRDYGRSTETIWDGDAQCHHHFGQPITKKKTGGGTTALIGLHRRGIGHYATKSCFCMKCGAWKGQLGLEPTFHLYLKHLFDIFREIKRVLKKSGTCWVNLGDTYGGSNMTSGLFSVSINGTV